MEQNELAHWLANLPDDEIEYVEWLVEEVDIALENMVIEQSGLTDARDVIKKFTLDKS
jgi:G3E family GTPase